jgi:hypothetical protein
MTAASVDSEYDPDKKEWITLNPKCTKLYGYWDEECVYHGYAKLKQSPEFTIKPINSIDFKAEFAVTTPPPCTNENDKRYQWFWRASGMKYTDKGCVTANSTNMGFQVGCVNTKTGIVEESIGFRVGIPSNEINHTGMYAVPIPIGCGVNGTNSDGYISNKCDSLPNTGKPVPYDSLVLVSSNNSLRELLRNSSVAISSVPNPFEEDSCDEDNNQSSYSCEDSLEFTLSFNFPQEVKDDPNSVYNKFKLYNLDKKTLTVRSGISGLVGGTDSEGNIFQYNACATVRDADGKSVVITNKFEECSGGWRFRSETSIDVYGREITYEYRDCMLYSDF